MSVFIQQLNFNQTNFFSELERKLSIENYDAASSVDDQVREIIADVRNRGDRAILEFTKKFDKYDVNNIESLRISSNRLNLALSSLPQALRNALEFAKERIENYHMHQKIEGWKFEDDAGHILGQQVRPLDSVGMYVPGGKASYPSSVLMNAIPAKVAGVKRLCMTVPTQNGTIQDLVLAAAALVGVDEVFAIGGAQAIAALAYGTETIKNVNKIVGPGNRYVASAKKQVFGKVGIDMIAGPSEILVYCDNHADPEWIALDLFSQAEHDELAQSICICESQEQLDAIKSKIESLLPQMKRQQVISNSLLNRGLFILVEDEQQALEVINYIAPEHLELSLEEKRAELLAEKIENAGAIFIGRMSAEVFGDYCAGSNHVLPTYGSARFSSPLGVYDFVKRSSFIKLNPQSMDTLISAAVELAFAEGLDAHGQSAIVRKNSTRK